MLLESSLAVTDAVPQEDVLGGGAVRVAGHHPRLLRLLVRRELLAGEVDLPPTGEPVPPMDALVGVVVP